MKKIIAVVATAAILLGAGQVLVANAKNLHTAADPIVSPSGAPLGAPVKAPHKSHKHGNHAFTSGDIRTGDIRGSFDFRSGDVRPSFDVRPPHAPKGPRFAPLSADARPSFDVRPPRAPKFNASFDARPSQDARPAFGAPGKGHKSGHGGPQFQLPVPAPAPSDSTQVTTSKFTKGLPFQTGSTGFGQRAPKRHP
jgi:hypothetical protein